MKTQKTNKKENSLLREEEKPKRKTRGRTKKKKAPEKLSIIYREKIYNKTPSPYVIDLKTLSAKECIPAEDIEKTEVQKRGDERILGWPKGLKTRIIELIRRKFLFFLYLFKKSDSLFSLRFLNNALPSKFQKNFRGSVKSKFWQELSLINLIYFLGFLIKSILEILKKPLSVVAESAQKEENYLNEAEESQPRLAWQIPGGWYKKLALFAVVSFLFILPVRALTYYQNLQETKKKILKEMSLALEHIELATGATSSFDLIQASSEFNLAAQNFSGAQNKLREINAAIFNILKLVPKEGKTVSAGEHLLVAGKNMSRAAEYLTKGLSFLNEKNRDFNPSSDSLTDRLALFKENLTLVLPLVSEARENLAKVKVKAIPEENQKTFIKIETVIPALENNLKDLGALLEDILKILGHDYSQRYLLIFQNNTELRATGGFMGSFALVDIDRGEIKKLEIPGGGSYDLQGNLLEQVIAPEPLHLINPEWQFQDANWFFDFPTSARKIMWFYEKSGGPTVDGVIAMDATLMENLIGILGEIEMADYNKVISKDNFLEETQMAVEVEYDREENQPKKFIADLAPKVLDEALNSSPEEFLNILEVLTKGLMEKHLLFYFNDKELEKKALDLNMAGEIKTVPVAGDYLAVVHSNIGGQKTDQVIKDKILHEVTIAEDGSIMGEVTITKIHQGEKGELFAGVNNVDYVRVYVPLGSILLAAEGFKAPPEEYFEIPGTNFSQDLDLARIQGEIEVDYRSGTRIHREIDKTVFGNWLQVEPGRSIVASFKYLLPFKLEEQLIEPKENFYLFSWLGSFFQNKESFSSYSLLVQKQPGTTQSEISVSIKIPPAQKTIWHYPVELKSRGFYWQTEEKLETDKFYAVIFKSAK